MTARRPAQEHVRPAAIQPQTKRRWLLLVHQLPSSPSNLRVRTWRRLQQLGAIAVKQAVYALPDSATAREDFEWLKAEIESAGGEALVLAADTVDAWSDDALVEEFRRSRQDGYAALAQDIEQVIRRLSAKRARSAGRAPAAARLLDTFRQRLGASERVDFFGAAGRDRVVSLLDALEARTTTRVRAAAGHASSESDGKTYRGRLWVTRPRPGVDRMSSAWLIRRFIDAEAQFGFAPDRDAVAKDALPFDMFGVRFSHHGPHCTFETLVETFAVSDAAVGRIAAIVHDLDLKDARFGAPEADTVGALIDGLQLAHADDVVLLSSGMALFDALYRSFQQSARRAGPRPVTPSRRASVARKAQRHARR